eukprot:1560451-Amphidinium_carterae.1
MMCSPEIAASSSTSHPRLTTSSEWTQLGTGKRVQLLHAIDAFSRSTIQSPLELPSWCRRVLSQVKFNRSPAFRNFQAHLHRVPLEECVWPCGKVDLPDHLFECTGSSLVMAKLSSVAICHHLDVLAHLQPRLLLKLLIDTGRVGLDLEVPETLFALEILHAERARALHFLRRAQRPLDLFARDTAEDTPSAGSLHRSQLHVPSQRSASGSLAGGRPPTSPNAFAAFDPSLVAGSAAPSHTAIWAPICVVQPLCGHSYSRHGGPDYARPYGQAEVGQISAEHKRGRGWGSPEFHATPSFLHTTNSFGSSTALPSSW